MELTCGVAFGGDGPAGGGGGGSWAGAGGGGGGGGWAGVAEPSMTARLCNAGVNGGAVATEEELVRASGLQRSGVSVSPICLMEVMTSCPTQICTREERWNSPTDYL